MKTSDKQKLPSSTLLQAFINKIEESGLVVKEAKKALGMEIITKESMADIGMPPIAGGFKIPYFNIHGQQTEFFRVRYLEDTRKGFAKATASKPQRYSQPAGTVNEVYMPPMVDWEEVLQNTEIPIVLTEGELKAACACALTIPTAGLGGVWCFKSKEASLPRLPWFDIVKWPRRKVYITYDSDAVTNIHVLHAETTLAKILTAKGALVYIVRLPTLGGARKTGLDDFLVARGAAEFKELLAEAKTYKQAEVLHRINEEMVYVRIPGIILELSTLHKMGLRQFTDLHYANVHYTEIVQTATMTKEVKKEAAKEWVKWEGRSEIARMLYRPGADRILEDGYNVWPGWGARPQLGDVEPWRKLLDYIFAGEWPARHWFEQWLAYPLQHPGAKLYTAAIVWGIYHGTGKSLIGNTIKKIYGKNATNVTDKNLQESHNEWCENKQFIMGDEIAVGSNKRDIADRLKNMITQTEIRVNPKFIPSYEINDCMNYYFTSNHPDAFFIEDNDRRFFVHEVKDPPVGLPFYEEYAAWMNSDAGINALFAYLLKLELKGFNPSGHAFLTASKTSMIEGGKSDVARWVLAVKRDADSMLRLGGSVLPYRLWSAEDLIKLYDPDEKGKVTINGLSRELKKAGIHAAAEGLGCRTSIGQRKLWILREKMFFHKMTIAEVGRYYDEEREITKKEPRYRK